jgi:hypothetical protein
LDEGEDEVGDMFDFGGAKMDFFKIRARQILIEQASPENYNYNEDFNIEMAYEGKPLPMKLCYQQLKNIMRRPAQSLGNNLTSGEQPGYLKTTFSCQRNAAPNSQVV